MSSEKLKQMILSDSGSIKDFAAKADVPYTTLYNAIRGDQQVSNMNISIFIKVAGALGMTADQLIEELSD